MTKSNLQLREVDGRQCWFSYYTALTDALPDGTTLGNDTRYSVTTSKHQARCRARHADILLYNVPRGTSDLRRYYLERVWVKIACHNCNHRREWHREYREECMEFGCTCTHMSETGC